MRLLLVTAWLSVAGCASTRGSPARPENGWVRVADCTGPAISLPAHIADTITPQSYVVKYADLASSVPGGYAGVLYDSAHLPVLLLTRPQAAESARAALVAPLAESHFPVMSATVQPVRWDYRQLATWYSYVYPQIRGDKGLALSHVDLIHNRISIGVVDANARDRMVHKLIRLNLPCDLVLVEITGANQGY
jgi:hypothetical protein